MRHAFAALLLLAACRPAVETDNQLAAPEPAPPAADPQVSNAEQLVRDRVASRGPVRFVEARSHDNRGARIVCGAYDQGGARHRYIVVGGEDVFVEPEMQAGQMERSVAEFCGDGERG